MTTSSAEFIYILKYRSYWDTEDSWYNEFFYLNRDDAYKNKERLSNKYPELQYSVDTVSAGN